jgi:hypothetical protein
MTSRILLELGEQAYAKLHSHLIRPGADVEQAAFGFAEKSDEADTVVFRLVEWMPVPPEGFEIQTAYHIELTDGMKAAAIKRAHDLRACLVEFHCHTGRWPAEFSGSDRLGFQEFVPHVLWRLRDRPYVAVVVARSGHDGLVWLKDPRAPQRLDGLRIGTRFLRATGLTPLSMDVYE